MSNGNGAHEFCLPSSQGEPASHWHRAAPACAPAAAWIKLYLENYKRYT